MPVHGWWRACAVVHLPVRAMLSVPMPGWAADTLYSTQPKKRNMSLPCAFSECLELPRRREPGEPPVTAPPTSWQVGGAGLETCTVQGCSRADGTVQQLTLVSIKNAPSLQQLVAATLPAGTQPSQLRSLDISSSCMALPAVSSCPFLGHLTRLSLCLCSFAYAGALVGLEPLLRQAPRLHSLAVVGCSSEATVPPALVHLTGLRRLSLRGSLRELPPGCYLSGELTRSPKGGCVVLSHAMHGRQQRWSRYVIFTGVQHGSDDFCPHANTRHLSWPHHLHP